MEQQQRRHITEVRGELYPGGLLTKEGCMERAGLGRKALEEARRSGMVRPIEANQRLYYRTSELIEWIESHAK
jgi:hypothetical protein